MTGLFFLYHEIVPPLNYTYIIYMWSWIVMVSEYSFLYFELVTIKNLFFGR